MFRAGDPRPQAHDMKANRSESNEGPRAKSDCPRSRSWHHASERLGVSELLHVLVVIVIVRIIDSLYCVVLCRRAKNMKDLKCLYGEYCRSPFLSNIGQSLSTIIGQRETSERAWVRMLGKVLAETKAYANRSLLP